MENILLGREIRDDIKNKEQILDIIFINENKEAREQFYRFIENYM